jgi:hypothetical protein
MAAPPAAPAAPSVQRDAVHMYKVRAGHDQPSQRATAGGRAAGERTAGRREKRAPAWTMRECVHVRACVRASLSVQRAFASACVRARTMARASQMARACVHAYACVERASVPPTSAPSAVPPTSTPPAVAPPAAPPASAPAALVVPAEVAAIGERQGCEREEGEKNEKDANLSLHGIPFRANDRA